mgnify:CR=1 FL=1
MVLKNILALAILATTLSSCIQAADTDREEMVAALKKEGALSTLHAWLSASGHLHSKDTTGCVKTFAKTAEFKQLVKSFGSVKGRAKVMCFSPSALAYFFSQATAAPDLTTLSPDDAVTLLVTQMHMALQKAREAQLNGSLEEMKKKAADERASQRTMAALTMKDEEERKRREWRPA